MNIHYGHSLDLPKPLERKVLLSKVQSTVKLSETKEVESLTYLCVFM